MWKYAIYFFWKGKWAKRQEANERMKLEDGSVRGMGNCYWNSSTYTRSLKMEYSLKFTILLDRLCQLQSEHHQTTMERRRRRFGIRTDRKFSSVLRWKKILFHFTFHPFKRSILIYIYERISIRWAAAGPATFSRFTQNNHHPYRFSIFSNFACMNKWNRKQNDELKNCRRAEDCLWKNCEIPMRSSTIVRATVGRFIWRLHPKIFSYSQKFSSGSPHPWYKIWKSENEQATKKNC